MDKSLLLHKLDGLKRIEKEYQGRLFKKEENDVQREQTKEHKSFKSKDPDYEVKCHNKHGVIFVNPSKIHSSQQRELPLLNQFSSSSQSVNKTKIYLNPNFKNSVLPSIQNNFNHKKGNSNNVGYENTVVHPGTSNFNKHITEPEICQKNNGNSNKPATSHFVKQLQKIYVNQHFTEPVRHEAKLLKVMYPDQKLCDGNTRTNCKNLQKPDIYGKQNNNTKGFCFESTNNYQTSLIVPDKKIFLNPKFKKRLSGSKTAYDSSLTNTNFTCNESRTSLGKDLENSLLNTRTKSSMVKGSQDLMSTKSDTTQSLPNNDRSTSANDKNTIGQRTRTGSTCLVSISATKVVRRRKSNLKIKPNVAGSSNKFAFLSKTKLVRNDILNYGTSYKSAIKNKLGKNDLNSKNKLKSLITRNNLQYLIPDNKINKLSKQSLISGLNMVDIVPKSTCVTKIKSNNGKSLQLITSNEGSNESVKSSVTTISLKNQPLFLSKTKLVRKFELGKDTNNEKAKCLTEAKSSNEEKSKTKQVLSKSHHNDTPLHKTITLKKQNAVCSKNISNNVSELSHVGLTKIRSNNGKSLKLVKNEIPQRCLKASTSERYSTAMKRRQLLQQQVNKNMLCMLRSKSRKAQFSKINNVSVKKISFQSPSQGSYVYTNKDVIARRQLTKAAVLQRRGSFVKVHASFFANKTKFIKSKYNLVRKYSHYPNSPAPKGNKDKPPSQLESRLKLKWRRQNSSRKTHSKRKELSIVNIGGIFYRCSRTSLTRNKPRPIKVLQKHNEGTILHIHGQKFKLERNGLTLTCLDKNPKRKRVDIGGVTFISSSSGTSLTRTNYHTARSILVHAKQKSISLLTRKLKKNNEPCLFFHRFGKCSGKERGTCVRQHDPKNVAVCKKYVQGSCSDGQCLLSHTTSCHNMPTCQHFLAGHCSRDHCLYPHIKVSDSAPICLEFLKGYCQLGDQCTKRHRDICPSFEKGVCPRGKYCPYPHPKSTSGKSLTRLTTLRKQKLSRDSEVVSSSNLRYFDDVSLQNENKQQPEEGHILLEDDCLPEEEEDKSLFRNRPKLGRLPSFIPLTDDF